MANDSQAAQTCRTSAEIIKKKFDYTKKLSTIKSLTVFFSKYSRKCTVCNIQIDHIEIISRANICTAENQ